jgi:uncharacterized protein YgbK (DUF1537 family)
MILTNRRLLIIADDLTGAADAGAAARRAHPKSKCVIIPWYGESSDNRAVDAWGRVDATQKPEILCVSTNSRNVDPVEAGVRVGKAVEWSTGRGFRLFKKIDSLLRGQVAAELASFMDASPSRACLLAPALPSQGRTTRGGIQYHRGERVAESQARKDPHAPPSSSRLDLLAPDGVTVHRLGVAEVREDSLPQKLLEYVAIGGLIIADALIEQDLQTLHDCALEIEALDLVGSAGLLSPNGLDQPTGWASARRPTLVVSASRRTEVEEQCDVLSRVVGESCCIVIHPSHCPDSAELARDVAETLHREGVCVVTVTPSTELDADENIRREVGAMLLRTLAESVCVTIPAVSSQALVVLIGGDLSQAVCERWSVESLSVLGTGIDGGVVASIVGRSDLADVRLIIRSGGFGGPDSLAELAFAARGSAEMGGAQPWFASD